jgi:hypothetical protein
MEREAIPVVRIPHIESGQEITLDPKAAETLALNIEVALENLGDQEVFLKATAAGTVLGGGALLVTNEHGAVWLAHGSNDKLIPPRLALPDLPPALPCRCLPPAHEEGRPEAAFPRGLPSKPSSVASETSRPSSAER